MTITTSYACFGCVEFAHNARTLAYHNWACRTGRYENPSCVPKLNTWLCSCPDDDPVEEFTDPITDGACWYDPLIPESADFLGVIVQRVSGLRSSTFTREILDGIKGGSILQQPLVKGKQLVFEVLILAATCAGMDYGIQWMRRQLEDDTRCPKAGSSCASCQGQMLTLRAHCAQDPTKVYDKGLHSFSAAGTVDGFTLVEDDFPLGQQCCCQFRRATFTMQTESANSYSTLPITSCTIKSNGAYVFGRAGSCADDVFVDPYANCCPFCPSTCDPCTTDPECDCVTPFILQPETISTTAPCFSAPICRCIGAACVSKVPSGYELAFRLNIFAGYDPLNLPFSESGLRNIVIRLFENPPTTTFPDGFPCPDDNATYSDIVANLQPCAELGVSWIPAASTLTIDGLSGKTWLSCNGACLDHSERVFAIGGDVFPLTSRCKNMIFTIEWDCCNVQESGVSPAMPSSVEVQSFIGFNL